MHQSVLPAPQYDAVLQSHFLLLFLAGNSFPKDVHVFYRVIDHFAVLESETSTFEIWMGKVQTVLTLEVAVGPK